MSWQKSCRVFRYISLNSCLHAWKSNDSYGNNRNLPPPPQKNRYCKSSYLPREKTLERIMGRRQKKFSWWICSLAIQAFLFEILLRKKTHYNEISVFLFLTCILINLCTGFYRARFARQLHSLYISSSWIMDISSLPFLGIKTNFGFCEVLIQMWFFEFWHIHIISSM